VIMLAGLQGSGKTTLAAKLGRWLKEQGHQPLLVAADLQRPNAVQQLQIVGERAGVPVFAPEQGSGVGDPVAVARASIDEARRRLHDVVIVDTAGRLGIDAEMMQQAADIRDAVQPDEILFVVDAMIGQDAVNTALAFLEGVGFDGVALTKLDGDARGGAALSVAQVTGRQVMFASNGEKLEDFDSFHPDRMASRILGMGDMLTLIEQAEKAFDADQAAKMAEKLQAGGRDFTLDDFLQQMESVRRMGSLSKLLGLLPGMGEIRDQLSAIDDRDLDRVAAMIKSMTPAEREEPKIINGSRRARIAKGSGSTVTEVNNLVERFFEARKMMQSMATGLPSLPGMPGMPGAGRGKKARGKTAKSSKGAKSAKARAKGGRSGNPARRALEQQAAESRRLTGAQPDAAGYQLPPDFELPPEFRDLLPPGQR
jgi:signal recognition particle subunit SRP54